MYTQIQPLTTICNTFVILPKCSYIKTQNIVPKVIYILNGAILLTTQAANSTLKNNEAKR